MNVPHLDADIDRTARRMIEVSPAADLRARVLARLDDRQPRITWTRAAWSTAAAALVIAALMRGVPAPAPVLIPSDEKGGSPVSSTSTPSLLPSALPPATRGRVVSPEAKQALAPRRAPNDSPLSAPIPPAVDDLAPIHVDEIVVAPAEAPAAIEPAEIVIAPLVDPADVVVEPLPVPPGSRE